MAPRRQCPLAAVATALGLLLFLLLRPFLRLLLGFGCGLVDQHGLRWHRLRRRHRRDVVPTSSNGASISPSEPAASRGRPSGMCATRSMRSVFSSIFFHRCFKAPSRGCCSAACSASRAVLATTSAPCLPVQRTTASNTTSSSAPSAPGSSRSRSIRYFGGSSAGLRSRFGRRAGAVPVRLLVRHADPAAGRRLHASRWRLRRSCTIPWGRGPDWHSLPGFRSCSATEHRCGLRAQAKVLRHVRAPVSDDACHHAIEVEAVAQHDHGCSK